MLKPASPTFQCRWKAGRPERVLRASWVSEHLIDPWLLWCEMPLADDSIGLITPLLNVNSFYQLYLSREP